MNRRDLLKAAIGAAATLPLGRLLVPEKTKPSFSFPEYLTHHPSDLSPNSYKTEHCTVSDAKDWIPGITDIEIEYAHCDLNDICIGVKAIQIINGTKFRIEIKLQCWNRIFSSYRSCDKSPFFRLQKDCTYLDWWIQYPNDLGDDGLRVKYTPVDPKEDVDPIYLGEVMRETWSKGPALSIIYEALKLQDLYIPDVIHGTNDEDKYEIVKVKVNGKQRHCSREWFNHIKKKHSVLKETEVAGLLYS